jgi:hypothetical protein
MLPIDRLRSLHPDDTAQVVIDYKQHVRVYYPYGKDPYVAYLGKKIVCEDLIEYTNKYLRSDTALTNAVNETYIVPAHDNAPYMIEAIIGDHLEINELSDLLHGDEKRTIRYEFKDTRIEITKDGIIIDTPYGTADSADPASIRLHTYALEVLRDPMSVWINGVHTSECALSTNAVSILEPNTKRKTIMSYLKDQPTSLLRIYITPSVEVRVMVNDSVVRSTKAFYNDKNTDAPELVSRAICELQKNPPRRGNTAYLQMDVVMAELVRRLLLHYISTPKYTILNKRNAIDFLKKNPHPFSVKKNVLTVQFNDWDERNLFEKKGCVSLFLTNLIDRPRTVPLKDEALRVYFPDFRRFYYFTVRPQNTVVNITICGEPDKPVISATLIEHTDPPKSVLDVDSFYHKIEHQSNKSTVKSPNFKGYGPRGMLLIKYIARHIGATDIDLMDTWTSATKAGLNSQTLQRALAKAEIVKGRHVLKDDKKLSRKNMENLRRFIEFCEEKDTYDNAASHGYYGGFGLTSGVARVKKGEVDAIKCAAYM